MEYRIFTKFRASIVCFIFAFTTLVSTGQTANAGNGRKIIGGLIGIGIGAAIINESRKRKKSRNRSRNRARSTSRNNRAAERRAARARRAAAVSPQNRVIQRSLNSLGYDVGKVDGIIGSGTRSQIAAWQASAGFAVTGVVTADQYNQLAQEAGVSTGSTIFSTSAYASQAEGQPTREAQLTRDEVRLLQRSLNRLGYSAGNVDGKLGRGTGRAVKRFLEDNNQDPETTSPRAALSIAAQKAGFDYNGPAGQETGGGSYAVAKPRSGETSIFETAADSLNSDDFAEAETSSLNNNGGGLDAFTLYNLNRGTVNSDATGVRDLIAMMIAANPGMLDDQEILAKLYEYDGGTHASTYRVAEDLAAYRNELISRPAPKSVRLKLEWNGSLKPGSFSRDKGQFPVSYSAFTNREDQPEAFFKMNFNLLNYNNRLEVTMPNMPDVNGINMNLEEAEAFEKRLWDRKINLVDTHVYTVIDNVSYDAEKNRMVASANAVIANLSKSYNDKTTFHNWPVEGAALGGLIAEKLNGANDFVDFMGGLRVVQDHVVVDDKGDWSRLAAALLLGQQPGLMDEDDTAIALAKNLLLPKEEELLWQGNPPRDNWRVNEFDWLDTANKVRAAFGDALTKRSVNTPFKLVEVRPVDLTRYDVNAGAFGLRYSRDKDIRFRSAYSSRAGAAAMTGSFGKTFLPDGLTIPIDLARKLDGVMRVKGNRRFYLGIYGTVDKISNVKRRPGSRSDAIYQLSVQPKVTRIALYADPAMSRLVFDYYGKKGSAIKRLQARKKSVFEAFAIEPAGFDKMALIADRLATEKGLLNRLIVHSDDYRQSNELEQDDIRITIESRLEFVDVPEEIWLAGRLTFGKYDTQKGGFPIAGISYVTPRSQSANFDADFKHELASDLQIVKMDRESARALLRKNRKREFTYRMRTKPIGASWKKVYTDDTQITLSHGVRELYILEGDRRTKDRDKAILARIVYERPGDTQTAVDVKADDSAGKEASTEVGASASPTLTHQLIASLLTQRLSGQVSDRGRRWLLAQQWLADKKLYSNEGRAFFQKSAKAPTRASYASLAGKYQSWVSGNPVATPKKMRISFHNGSNAMYLSGGITVGIDGTLRAAQCNLFRFGFWDDLGQKQGIGDVRKFREKQNTLMYKGTPEKPSVMSPVMMVFQDNPFNCTDRVGERLEKNFVGDTDKWAPRVQVVFDRLPHPPVGPSASAYMIDTEVTVQGIDFIEKGDDLPDVVVRVAFDSATYNDFDNGQKTPLYTLTREDTEPKIATAAGGGEFDVVGVKIGMTIDEAEVAVAAHFGEYDTLTPVVQPSENTAPFKYGLMYVNKQRNERIAIFMENDGNDPIVLGVERIQRTAENWGVPRKAVIRAGHKKYGKPNLQTVGDYESELIWGDNATSNNAPGGSYGSGCQLAYSQSERIDVWQDQNGTKHNIWEYFNWGEVRNSGIAYMPNFDNYQPEFAERFLSCGNYVRLKHTSDALATVLIDIKRYMTAYYAAGKRLKESLQNAADIEEEEAADIKL